MSKKAHTPGKWEAKGLYVFAGNNCIGVCDTDNATETRMKANARVMAAAPDLLEALERLLESYTDLANSGDCGFWNPEEEEIIIAARAALSKATGGE